MRPLEIDSDGDIVTLDGEVVVSKRHGYDSEEDDLVAAMVEAYNKNEVDQMKFISCVPGIGENLLTTSRYFDGKGQRFAGDVTCQICKQSVACGCNKDGNIADIDRRFWLHHFQMFHAELLPPEVKTIEEEA